MNIDLLISSTKNPKLQAASLLYERRHRDQTALFLVEGYREIYRAVEAGVLFESLFFAPDYFLGVNEEALLEKVRKGGVKLYECTKSCFAKLSYRDRPDGLVGVAKKREKTLADLKCSANPFFVVAEAIEKPGNLGTILRSADAVGVDGVIVSDPRTDVYNPNVVRASTGTLFTIPVIEARGDSVLAWLHQNKIAIVAATPSASIEFTKAPLQGPVAIIVGTEQLGLSDFWMQAATIKVRIPMCGVADSLNVATATTLLLYEVLRQRLC